MKQETLEEVAEIFVDNRFTKQICGDESYPDILASKSSIVESHILFAKWQMDKQERSYSEEEVLSFCEWFAYEIEHYNYPKNKDIVKALEQFKKK